MSNDPTPEILALLREEEHHSKSAQRGERRIKLEKGKTWRIRFIPARLGPRETWFARIARHWVNFKPILCPVQTHPDFGGNPDAYCPACEMSVILNDSADDVVSKFGFKSRAGTQWLTYAIVQDMDGDEVTGTDLLNPYEMWHYQNTWDELKGFFKGSYTRGNPLSVLDYRRGNIFAITRTAKSTRLDKLDQCPIFDDTDPAFESHIERVESLIKFPRLTIPTQEQLEAFAAKMEEAAYKTETGRRAPAVSDDPLTDNDDEPAAPARRPAPSPAPVVARAPRPATPAPAPVAARPAAAAPRPAPAAARPAPAPAAARPAPAPALRPAPAPAAARPAPAPAAARPAPAPLRPRPLPQEQPPELDEPPAEPVDDSNPELSPEEQAPEEQAPEELADSSFAADSDEQPLEQPVAPPRRPAPAPQRAPAASGRRLPPMPAASEPVGAVDEGAEEEQLPEETSDQAPAAPVDEQESEIAPPPPPLARRGAPPTALGSAIRQRVAAMTNRAGG